MTAADSLDVPPNETASLDARFYEVCERASLRVADLAPRIKERMLLLAHYTNTFDDCVRAMDLAELVFVHYERHLQAFGDLEKNIVRAGSLLSDIGKTGPLRASREQQELCVRMYGVEGVRNDKLPVSEFFQTYFGAEASHCIEHFRSLGLDAAMPIRTFWNLHGEWTYELLRNSGVPHEAVPAAAAHHLLEHVNPDELVGEDGAFTRAFGTNLAFDRPEKLVILLDKYDALRRRARFDHEAAMAWLRRLLTNHKRFGNDREFHTLLDAMDVVFAHATHADWRVD